MNKKSAGQSVTERQFHDRKFICSFFLNKMFYSIFVQFTNMKGNINLHSYNNHQSQ